MAEMLQQSWQGLHAHRVAAHKNIPDPCMAIQSVESVDTSVKICTNPAEKAGTLHLGS